MRITTKMVYDSILSSMQSGLKETNDLYDKLSSGKKVNRPSDDPSAMSQITGYNVQLSNIKQYQRTIGAVKTEINSANSALQGLYDNMTLLRSMAAKATSMGTADRTSYSEAVQSILSSLNDIANTKVGDKYIFSGAKSDTPAINTATGEYQGTSDKTEAIIGNGVKIVTNVPGNQLFSFKLPTGAPAAGILPSYNDPFSANPVGANPASPAPGTPYDADPSSALQTTTGVADPNAAFTAGGNLSINGGATFAVAAGTLNQVRDAINAANAGAKASVVNVDQSGVSPDYRLVVASSISGKSKDLTITVTGGDAALNNLAYDDSTKNMTLSKDIVNYNYITDQTNPNYYSFNNNYLNKNNMLRAVNFLKEAMANDDTGRISKSLDYLTNLTDKVSNSQIDLGLRLDQLETADNFESTMKENVTKNRTDIRDVSQLEYASMSIQVQLKQAALESLRKLSTTMMQSSLFDYL